MPGGGGCGGDATGARAAAGDNGHRLAVIGLTHPVLNSLNDEASKSRSSSQRRTKRAEHSEDRGAPEDPRLGATRRRRRFASDRVDDKISVIE